METIKFYQVKNIASGCPRRSLFYLNNIEGKSQYYTAKKKFTTQKIIDYTVGRFGLDAVDPVYEPGEFDGRLSSETLDDIMSNFDALIKGHDITVSSVNRDLEYEVDGLGTVKLNIDAIGTFEGADAVFKIVPTTKFSRDYAWELILAEKTIRGDINYRLIVLKLGNGTFREISKLGDRNKDGSLSKRSGALGPWESLRAESEKMIREGWKVLSEMESNPTQYNSPRFGGCGTCPFHNYEVIFNGETVTCSG